MRTFIDFDDKKIEKEYIKEKYIITKKENICQEVEEPLSVEDINKRNNYIQKENEEFKVQKNIKKLKGIIQKNLLNIKNINILKIKKKTLIKLKLLMI